MTTNNLGMRPVIAAISLGLMTWATGAAAAPMIFFGENQSPGGTVSGAPLTQRNAFLGNLSGGVGTEDFEGIALGTTDPFGISFPGSSGAITANWTGGGSDIADSTTDVGAGRFATSGSQWVRTSGEITLDFSSPIAAFGFFGTDVGDFSGSMTIDLTPSGGGADVNFVVPHTVNGNNGSLLFWGFVDPSQDYTAITFGNTAAGSDFFGYEDMTIGDLQQVRLVPEPGSFGLLGLALAAIGWRRRRST